MGIVLVDAVNCGFAWLIVACSVAGYLLTLKRLRERWALWPILGLGWTLLAIANTLLLTGVAMAWEQLVALWLSSYILVAASLLLLFLKLVRIVRRPGSLSGT